MFLTQLADVARRTGRPVKEVAGWRTRTTVPAGMTGVKTTVCHHTASPGRGEMSVDLLVQGRPGLGGPLSQYGLGRSGTIYVIAAGRCSHAGRVLAPRFANEYAVGIEAMNDGLSEPWGDELMESYRLLCRELIAEFGLTVDDVLGHKEICSPPGRKLDPSFSMPAFRASIAGLAAQPPSPPAPEPPAHQEITVFMAETKNPGGANTLWLSDGFRKKKVLQDNTAHVYNRAGVPNIGVVLGADLAEFPTEVTMSDIVGNARDAILAAVREAQAAHPTAGGPTPEQIADVIAQRLSA